MTPHWRGRDQCQGNVLFSLKDINKCDIKVKLYCFTVYAFTKCAVPLTKSAIFIYYICSNVYIWGPGFLFPSFLSGYHGKNAIESVWKCLAFFWINLNLKQIKLKTFCFLTGSFGLQSTLARRFKLSFKSGTYWGVSSSCSKNVNCK